MLHNITSIGEILFDVFPAYKVMGGAPFNFIYHISKLTGQGTFVSRIGNDPEGDEITGFLERNGISDKYVQKDMLHPTGQALVSTKSFGEPDFVLKEKCAYDFIELNNELLNLITRKNSLLYYGTLAQRNPVSRNTIWTLLDMKVRSFCDINLRQEYYNTDILMTSLRAADIVKLNHEELIVLEKVFLGRNYKLGDAAMALKDKFNISLLCITLGADGAYLFGTNNEKNYFRLDKNIRIVDTVGAGDAYSAVLALGYMNGWSIEQINHAASDFAAEICAVPGALPPDDSLYTKLLDEISRG